MLLLFIHLSNPCGDFVVDVAVALTSPLEL